MLLATVIPLRALLLDRAWPTRVGNWRSWRVQPRVVLGRLSIRPLRCRVWAWVLTLPAHRSRSSGTPTSELCARTLVCLCMRCRGYRQAAEYEKYTSCVQLRCLLLVSSAQVIPHKTKLVVIAAFNTTYLNVNNGDSSEGTPTCNQFNSRGHGLLRKRPRACSAPDGGGVRPRTPHRPRLPCTSVRQLHPGRGRTADATAGNATRRDTHRVVQQPRH